MKTVEYMELLRDLTETGSDYAVAKLLGIRQSVVTHHAHGRPFSEQTSILVAEKLGIDPAVVMADMNAERAKRSDVKEVWEKAADQLRQVAAVLVIGLVGLGVVAPSPADAATAPNQYILCKKRRRWLDWLDELLEWSGTILAPV